MTRAAWIDSPRLSKKQREEIEAELGDSAPTYITGAEDALLWYAGMRHFSETESSPAQQRAQVLRVAKAYRAAANALNRLDDRAADLLRLQAARRQKITPSLTASDLIDLAKDAESALPPIKRGVDGPRLILVQQLARHFKLATGRRPGITANGPFARALLPVLKAARIPSTNIRPLIRRAINR